MAKPQLECSFCGRKKSETNLLIAGIDAHICDKCIEQAHGIVLEELKQSKKTAKEIETLTPFKVFAGNKPTNSFLVKKITPETIVFNNLVQNLAEFQEKWEVPIKDSWHKLVFADHFA